MAVEVASQLGCEVISADSRQIFRDIPIVSAAPTPDEMAGVPHQFVSVLPLDAYYSAARFEADVMALLPSLWAKSPYAVLCGGSMMYIDAVTDGIDDLPDIPSSTRQFVANLLRENGLPGVLAQLDILDPEYAAQVDRSNPKRVVHALEICLASGRPYSDLRQGRRAHRPFDIIKVAIDRPRPELFDRINSRVGDMLSRGLLDEARRLYPLRHLNSLNTVGLKELFAHFDGLMDLDTALARMAKNTRVYAKKQLTWLSRPSIRPTIMLPPAIATQTIIQLAEKSITNNPS